MPVEPTMRGPDWVMLGVPTGDRVQLWASRTLTRAQLDMTASVYDPPPYYDEWGDRRYVGARSIVLRVEMGDAVMVEAATYAEALRSLLESWSPDQPSAHPAAALMQSRPELEA